MKDGKSGLARGRCGLSGRGRGLVLGMLLAGLSAVPAAVAGGVDSGDRPSPARVAAGGTTGPSLADFKQLQAEVREQRQLIVEMLQTEQQRYEMLLKLIRAQSGAPLPDLPRASAPAAAGNDASPVAVASDTTAGGGGGHRAGPGGGGADRQRHGGSVAGRVELSGGEPSDVYVYVENVKGAPVRGKTLEIRQENKQFSPRLAVVQTGTSVVFPNFDSVYHNVFSNSPRNSFDLGSSRSGDAPRAVTLTKPGVVEVFCNMHQKMSANLLVVPSALYTKVRADGTFRIDNVPFGSRKIVAWSPRAKPIEQQVEVTAAGAALTFALQAEGDDHKAHLNKTGQAYGSYRE